MDRVVELRDGRLVAEEEVRGAVRDGTLRRLLTLADAPRARLALAVALGALAVVLGIGLLALSGYLISRAAEQPPVLSLTVAIVFVRFFGVARPLARYLERITSHDVAFRTLGTLRARLFARIEPLAPAGLASFRRGDLLSRMVADVDALQDLYLRGHPAAARRGDRRGRGGRGERGVRARGGRGPARRAARAGPPRPGARSAADPRRRRPPGRGPRAAQRRARRDAPRGPRARRLRRGHRPGPPHRRGRPRAGPRRAARHARRRAPPTRSASSWPASRWPGSPRWPSPPTTRARWTGC